MEKTNYCKTVDGMSRCTTDSKKDRENCPFFEKASVSARDPEQCRHYRPDLGNHCDSIKAQIDAAKPATNNKDNIVADFSY